MTLPYMPQHMSHACIASWTPMQTCQFIQLASKSFFSNVTDPLLCYHHTQAWAAKEPASRTITATPWAEYVQGSAPNRYWLLRHLESSVSFGMLCQHNDPMKLCPPALPIIRGQHKLPTYCPPWVHYSTQRPLCGYCSQGNCQADLKHSQLHYGPSILKYCHMYAAFCSGETHTWQPVSLAPPGMKPPSTSIRTSQATACRPPSDVLSSFPLQMPSLQKVYRRNPTIWRVIFTTTTWMISTCAIFTQVPSCHMAFSQCSDFNQAQVSMTMWWRL